MDTVREYKVLLEEAEGRLRSLSSERLQVANEFMAYLEEQEKRDRENRRERFLKAHESIMQIREEVKARTGIHPNSVPLIRQLREGGEYSG